MQVPLQIRFVNTDSSPTVENAIRDGAKTLGRFAEHIVSCRVNVEAPHGRHRKGQIYHIVIDVRMPGGEIIASRDPSQHHAHEDVYVALRDAFKAARRQLQDHVRVNRGKVKSHDVPAHGKILEIHPDESYGRIETPDGRLIYFHRNSLLGADFDHLEAGADVRFHEEQGDEGPQASSVSLIGKHHLTD